ncbi:hypothetical protein SEA_YECEY3_71 [Mycobacterium phage Yecey3]|uniref:Lipoprotein n=1 Tax=Mycobacterium phage Yecey3 TaxID=2656617 RepID=A0A649VA72_9CAUD|nr:hypothetical protein KIV58_gp038 [Mycobacterium phage Yecey3]QGJ88822.1 hypothetical protein SEA_YECEY3_71 [Mycobacterium phage Yecey3]
MKKAIAAVMLAGVAALGLSACSSTPTGSEVKQEPFGVRANPHYVDLPDGRKVLCIYEATDFSSKSGGPSCDWAGAKK